MGEGNTSSVNCSRSDARFTRSRRTRFDENTRAVDRIHKKIQSGSRIGWFWCVLLRSLTVQFQGPHEATKPKGLLHPGQS